MAKTDLEQLLRTIAPDFAGVPLYIYLVSEGLPEQFVVSGSACWGYTGPRLDVALREYTGPTDRGVAIVLNDVAMRDDVAHYVTDDPHLAEELVEQRVVAILLHEAAHALDQGIDLAPVDAEEAVRLTSFTTAMCSIDVPWHFSVPWLGHDGRWLRIVLHLAWRAGVLGHPVPLSLLTNPRLYELSTPWLYEDALGDEAERLQSLCFAAVLAVPPPASFAALWQSDVRRWIALAAEGHAQRLAAAGKSLDLFVGG